MKVAALFSVLALAVTSSMPLPIAPRHRLSIERLRGIWPSHHVARLRSFPSCLPALLRLIEQQFDITHGDESLGRIVFGPFLLNARLPLTS
jgi:hypothetical protein